MIHIYDDIVSKESQDRIESILLGEEFPWFFSDYTVDMYNNNTVDLDYPHTKEYLQFTHGFYRQEPFYISTHYKEVKFLFDEFVKNANIKVSDLLRVKANLQTQCAFSNSHFYNTPHIDQPMNHTVAIYYGNDSDGNTYIFSGGEVVKEITPKKGRFVVFDGHMYHAGRHPMKSPKRVVINYNFI